MLFTIIKRWNIRVKSRVCFFSRWQEKDSKKDIVQGSNIPIVQFEKFVEPVNNIEKRKRFDKTTIIPHRGSFLHMVVCFLILVRSEIICRLRTPDTFHIILQSFDLTFEYFILENGCSHRLYKKLIQIHKRFFKTYTNLILLCKRWNTYIFKFNLWGLCNIFPELPWPLKFLGRIFHKSQSRSTDINMGCYHNENQMGLQEIYLISLHVSHIYIYIKTTLARNWQLPSLINNMSMSS